MEKESDINSTPAIVETHQISRNFGPVKAVDEVCIKVYPREIFGLLGPNGAGKTTLMKMLTTLLPVSSGNAYLDKIDVVKFPAQTRYLIGYVPQLISADGSLTGYENLLLFSKLYDIPRSLRKSRIKEALELMALTEVADKFVKEYSGGMIRRLEIVQSMLHHPKVLFLDEPTTGLDPIARKAVWEHLIRAHVNYGVTIVFTTHDMEEADTLSHRIAIMNRGQIVVIDKPAVLKHQLGPNATLEDVFIHFTGESLDYPTQESFREITRQRKTGARRG